MSSSTSAPGNGNPAAKTDLETLKNDMKALRADLAALLRDTGSLAQEQAKAAVVAHHWLPMIMRAIASRKVPVAIAASSSFHCWTGTLPMVSPVRPLTAM